MKIVCYKGYFDIVEKVIEVGIDVNLSDGVNILLIVVCYKGYLEILNKLIEVGVNVN